MGEENRMKNTKIKRGLAFAFSLLFMINLCAGGMSLPIAAYGYAERSASVNATSLNVRSAPGTGNSVVAKLYHGAAVTVIDEKNASDGSKWFQIRFNNNGSEKTGYVAQSYIKFPVTYKNDADFEAYLNAQGFPESYKPGLRQLHAEYPNWVFTAQKVQPDWNSVIQNESIVGANLVGSGSISSWKSTADGAYDWNSSTWPGFDTSSWVAASEDIIKYYMDPRNFLDSTYVFQFLLQKYDGNQQTRAGIESMIKGTFMSGASVPSSGGSGSTGGSGAGPSGGNSGGSTNPTDYGPGVVNSGSSGNSENSGAANGGDSPGAKLEGPQASISKKETGLLTSSYGPGMVGDGPGASAAGSPGSSGTPVVSGSTNYADIIMNAGAQSGVNPYVLAAMIIQEQGPSGSGSVSGTTAGYEGYYNFFNIEAYASGNLTPIQRGLWYASQSGSCERPWNSVEKSILGGAVYYGTNYVKVGQDTFYLKKFNVQGSNLYKHQYMTNIQGAAGEGAKLAQAYSAEMKNTALEFKIPVYSGMPDSACPRPTGEGSPNNKLQNLTVNGFSITPTFSRDVLAYDLIVDPSVSSVTISAAALDSKAKVTGVGNVSLQSGNNDIKVSVQAENGTMREYVLHVVRQGNGQTGSGQNTSPAGPGSAGPGAAPQAPAETTAAAVSQPPAQPPAGNSPAGPGATQAPAETTAAAVSGVSGVQMGDLDGDGSITGTDVALLQKYILGQGDFNDLQKAVADLSGDGVIDLKDLTLLQRKLLGIQ